MTAHVTALVDCQMCQATGECRVADSRDEYGVWDDYYYSCPGCAGTGLAGG